MASKTKVPEDKIQKLREIAKRVWREYGITGEAAIVGEIGSNGLAAAAVEYAARILLHEAKRHERAVIVHSSAGLSADAPQSGEADETYPIPRAGDWPLHNGIRLRDSTEEDLINQELLHDQQARGHARSAEFMRRVLQLRKRKRVAKNAPTSSKISDEQLDTIRDEVFADEQEAAA